MYHRKQILTHKASWRLFRFKEKQRGDFRVTNTKWKLGNLLLSKCPLTPFPFVQNGFYRHELIGIVVAATYPPSILNICAYFSFQIHVWNPGRVIDKHFWAVSAAGSTLPFPWIPQCNKARPIWYQIEMKCSQIATVTWNNIVTAVLINSSKRKWEKLIIFPFKICQSNENILCDKS